MISIGKLTDPEQAVAYLAEAQVAVAADYYLGRGEMPGLWSGRGAEALYLWGQVTPEAFRAVLDGRDPSTGEPLGRRWGAQRVVAFDVTFSAPKSVSVLYALGDADVRREVLAAHESAVAAVVEHIEAHAAFARQADPATGDIVPVPAELILPRFTHRTARPVTDPATGRTVVDPQLHTHIPIPAWVRREDGSWSALHSAPLYREAATAGAVGQAVLRRELIERLGVDVEVRRNGTFEIAGIGKELREEFSRRTAQIKALEEGLDVSSLAGHKLAVRASRQSKREVEPGGDLFAEWRDRAQRFTGGHAWLDGILGRVQQPEPLALTHDRIQELLGPRGLTKDSATFTRRTLLRTLAASAARGARRGDLETIADAILADPQVVVPMEVSERDHAQGRRYSTPEMVALEASMLAQAMAARASGRVVVPEEAVAAVVDRRPTLTYGQRAIVDAVCRSTDGVVVIEGAAGAGKTYALDACREALQAAGHDVVGLALAARAAEGMEAEAGIPSRTLASWMGSLESLRHGGVVVLDEAGMVGSRQLAEVVKLTLAFNRKLVLVGDSHQLQPIGAGAAFRALGDHLGRTVVDENVRQREPWERDALRELRDGSGILAAGMYAERQRIVSCETAHERRVLMARTYLDERALGRDAVILAQTREEVRAINDLVRVARVADGQLDGPELSVKGRTFSAGDEVLCLRNDRRHGVTNGLRGTVADVDVDHGTLTVATKDKRTVVIDAARYTHLDHGYAMTVHKAQGMTTDVALVAGTDRGDREWIYTAMSRNRDRSVYFTLGQRELDPQGEQHGQSQTQERTRDWQRTWELSRAADSTLDRSRSMGM